VRIADGIGLPTLTKREFEYAERKVKILYHRIAIEIRGCPKRNQEASSSFGCRLDFVDRIFAHCGRSTKYNEASLNSKLAVFHSQNSDLACLLYCL